MNKMCVFPKTQKSRGRVFKWWTRFWNPTIIKWWTRFWNLTIIKCFDSFFAISKEKIMIFMTYTILSITETLNFQAPYNCLSTVLFKQDGFHLSIILILNTFQKLVLCYFACWRWFWQKFGVLHKMLNFMSYSWFIGVFLPLTKHALLSGILF